MSTFMAKAETIERRWFVIDAAGESLGRTAVKAANILRGKHRPEFTPHVDCGEFVIIINADKIILTGKKMTDKTYLTYSGYPGGQHSYSPAELIKRHKGYERIVRHAVKGMLPKGLLGRKVLGNLYIYEGSEHKHEAQSPKTIDINALK